jgi:hypothetical protein
MDFSFLVRIEWAIPELILLPLLFWDLYLTRRSQRRDREKDRLEKAGREEKDSSNV